MKLMTSHSKSIDGAKILLTPQDWGADDELLHDAIDADLADAFADFLHKLHDSSGIEVKSRPSQTGDLSSYDGVEAFGLTQVFEEFVEDYKKSARFDLLLDKQGLWTKPLTR
jgi:hypothetical protein